MLTNSNIALFVTEYLISIVGITWGQATWHGGCVTAAWWGGRAVCTAGGRWGRFCRWPTPERPWQRPGDAAAWSDSAAPRCPLTSWDTCLVTHTHTQKNKQVTRAWMKITSLVIAAPSLATLYDDLSLYFPRILVIFQSNIFSKQICLTIEKIMTADKLLFFWRQELICNSEQNNYIMWQFDMKKHITSRQVSHSESKCTIQPSLILLCTFVLLLPQCQNVSWKSSIHWTTNAAGELQEAVKRNQKCTN